MYAGSEAGSRRGIRRCCPGLPLLCGRQHLRAKGNTNEESKKALGTHAEKSHAEVVKVLTADKRKEMDALLKKSAATPTAVATVPTSSSAAARCAGTASVPSNRRGSSCARL